MPQYYLGLAAEVLLAAGRPADGLAHLDRAIAGIDEPGVGFYLPEIYRLRGECLLALGRDNKEDARLSVRERSRHSRRQGAVIFERRAEASLSEVASIGMRDNGAASVSTGRPVFMSIADAQFTCTYGLAATSSNASSQRFISRRGGLGFDDDACRTPRCCVFGFLTDFDLAGDEFIGIGA